MAHGDGVLLRRRNVQEAAPRSARRRAVRPRREGERVRRRDAGDAAADRGRGDVAAAPQPDGAGAVEPGGGGEPRDGVLRVHVAAGVHGGGRGAAVAAGRDRARPRQQRRGRQALRRSLQGHRVRRGRRRPELPEAGVPGARPAVPEPAAAVDGVAEAEVLRQPVARRRPRGGGRHLRLHRHPGGLLRSELQKRMMRVYWQRQWSMCIASSLLYNMPLSL